MKCIALFWVCCFLFFMVMDPNDRGRLKQRCYKRVAGLLQFRDKPFWPVTFEKYGQEGPPHP